MRAVYITRRQRFRDVPEILPKGAIILKKADNGIKNAAKRKNGKEYLQAEAGIQAETRKKIESDNTQKFCKNQEASIRKSGNQAVKEREPKTREGPAVKSAEMGAPLGRFLPQSR